MSTFDAAINAVGEIAGTLAEFLFARTSRKKNLTLTLHNSLSNKTESFVPLNNKKVTMYNCGPTAYDVAHIGNLYSYVFADIISRTLALNGYAVKQVINITDFGHLSTDGDLGDDKMTKALKREGKELTLENMRALAEKYTLIFINDLSELNIETSRITFPRASDFISQQIALIETLEKKGFAYRTDDGVYFDTARFPEYGKLGDIKLAALKEGARVIASEYKRNPTDFLLWKPDHHLGWDSPWGLGFPGWHIECSAMIQATLGEQIDIHTGGIDLQPTHHNNEIAQSECATGKKPFSKYWLHHAFLTIKDTKISKSLGNIINLSTVKEKGFHPLALRYLFLTTHYRSPSNFTWEALQAAQSAYLKLQKLTDDLSDEAGDTPPHFKRDFTVAINDDLNTPKALAALWQLLNDASIASADKHKAILFADRVFGLRLAHPDERVCEMYTKEMGSRVQATDIPEHVLQLLEAREMARADRQWDRADNVRKKIEAEGYRIEDTADGPRLVQF